LRKARRNAWLFLRAAEKRRHLENMMAQENVLPASRMTRTPKATGPELRIISMRALPGEPTGREVTAPSSWKRNTARASGEARICKIIGSIVRRYGLGVGEGNPARFEVGIRFEVRGTRFEGRASAATVARTAARMSSAGSGAEWEELALG
jgi:hypothetical protein